MAFSDALLQLDVSPLWAILFFVMLILLGIDSEFGTLEAVIGPLMELGAFPKKWRKEVVTGKKNIKTNSDNSKNSNNKMNKPIHFFTHHGNLCKSKYYGLYTPLYKQLPTSHTRKYNILV